MANRSIVRTTTEKQDNKPCTECGHLLDMHGVSEKQTSCTGRPTMVIVCPLRVAQVYPKQAHLNAEDPIVISDDDDSVPATPAASKTVVPDAPRKRPREAEATAGPTAAARVLPF